MCTVVVRSDPFFLLSNRDEFLDRPAAPLHRWPDQPILGGRDLRSGGAWLGFGAGGRWAVLTNLPGPPPENPPTRGRLVQDFLSGSLSPQDYARSIERERYAGFNLLLGTPQGITYLSNRSPARPLGADLQVLGNTLVDEPSERTDRAYELVLHAQAHSPQQWLDLFQDALVRIDLGVYGTRCTTLALLQGRDLHVWERTRGQTALVHQTWPGWI